MNDHAGRPILVYYHIPSDHDDADHPNAFPLFRSSKDTSSATESQSNPVRLRDIKQRFPLPGKYHFRFKVKLENTFFWIDIANDDSVVPQFNNRIIAKVLRVDWNSSSNQHNSNASSPSVSRRPSSHSDQHHRPAPPNTSSTSNVRRENNITNNDMLFLDSPATAQPTNQQPNSLPHQPPTGCSNNSSGLEDFFS